MENETIEDGLANSDRYRLPVSIGVHDSTLSRTDLSQSLEKGWEMTVYAAKAGKMEMGRLG